MPSKDCLVCATDEGLFLDVFTNCKELHDIIQNLLSLEVQKTNTSRNICYKCAYELTECSKFVNKFKEAHKTSTPKLKKNGYCSLCQEPGKKGFLYELKDEILNNALKQIDDIFQHDLTSVFKNVYMCLYCKYNLDVLMDLKKVAESSLKNGASPSFPTVNVKIIKRKTTSPPSPKLSTDTSDTDTSITKTSKKNTSKTISPSPINNRQCDKCELKVENGVDMYRFHHTGQTVCKDCWVSVEPEKSSKHHKKNTSETSTKRCAVFLKDVLINPPDEKSADQKKMKRAMRTEKDSAGNTIYIISDDSEVEPSSPRNTRRGKKRASSENDTKPTKKGKRSFESIPRRQTRATSVISNSSKSSRAPPKRRYSDDAEAPEFVPKKLRSRGKKLVKPPETKADDKPVTKPVRLTRSSRKLSLCKSLSSSDESSNKLQNSSKLLESRDKSYSPASSRASSTSSRSRREKSQDEDEKINVEEKLRKSKRIKKWQRSDTEKSLELSREIVEKSSKKINKKTKAERSRREESKMPESSRNDLAVKSEEKLKNDDEIIEIESSEEGVNDDKDNQSYTCTVCSNEFDTKVEGMTHELTHSKKLEVVLEKVAVDDEVKDDGEHEGSNDKATSSKPDDSCETVDTPQADKVSEKNDEAEEKIEEVLCENGNDKEENSHAEISGDVNAKDKSVEGNEQHEEAKEVEERTVDVEETAENPDDENAKEGKEETEEKEEVRKHTESFSEKEKQKDEEEESTPVKTAEDNETTEISSRKSEERIIPESPEPGKISESLETDKKDVTTAEESQKLDDEADEPVEKPDVPVSEEISKEDGEEDEENVQIDEVEVDKDNKGEKEHESELRHNAEEDSDEEKSPEPEPLSPAPPIPLNDDADENASEDTSKTEVSELNSTNESKKSEENSGDKMIEQTDGKESEEADENHVSSEILKKKPNDGTGIDDVSMDAIEKEMESIVGFNADKNDKDVNNDNNLVDEKITEDVPILDSANEEIQKIS